MFIFNNKSFNSKNEVIVSIKEWLEFQIKHGNELINYINDVILSLNTDFTIATNKEDELGLKYMENVLPQMEDIFNNLYSELLQTKDIDLLIEIVEKFTDLDANVNEIEKLRESKSPIERKFLEKIPRQSFEIGIRICEKLNEFCNQLENQDIEIG